MYNIYHLCSRDFFDLTFNSILNTSRKIKLGMKWCEEDHAVLGDSFFFIENWGRNHGQSVFMIKTIFYFSNHIPWTAICRWVCDMFLQIQPLNILGRFFFVSCHQHFISNPSLSLWFHLWLSLPFSFTSYIFSMQLSESMLIYSPELVCLAFYCKLKKIQLKHII